MDDQFDPYHKWLGIRPEQQPPDHYRLLGIARFEHDPDVITTAADRQMAHLRTYQTGRHAKHSQRLLNELARARACLLDEGRRAEYDAELRVSTAVPSRDTSAVEPSPPDEMPSDEEMPSEKAATFSESTSGLLFPAISTSPSSPPSIGPSQRQRAAAFQRRRPNRRWIVLAAGISLVVVLTALLAIVLALSTTHDANLALEEQARPASKPRDIVLPALADDAAATSPTAADDFRLAVLVKEDERADVEIEVLDEQQHKIDLHELRSKAYWTHTAYAISPGSYTIRLRRHGYEPIEQEVTVAETGVTRAPADWVPVLTETQDGLEKGRGLIGEYFTGRDFSACVMSRIDAQINHLWVRDAPDHRLPEDNFSVRWKGYLKAPRPGRYQLAIDADDSMTVWIDDNQVCHAFCSQALADVDLSDRPHRIRVEYVEYGGDAHMALLWSLPGAFVRQTIPTEALFFDQEVAEHTTVPELVMRPVPSAGTIKSRSSPSVDRVRSAGRASYAATASESA